jgi:hypothetical protein
VSKTRTTVELEPRVEWTATNTRTREIVEGDARRVVLEATRWVTAGDIVVLGKLDDRTVLVENTDFPPGTVGRHDGLTDDMGG